MGYWTYEEKCQNCKADIKVHWEDACGPPREAIGDCAKCGLVSVFLLEWSYAYEVGEFLRHEGEAFPVEDEELD